MFFLGWKRLLPFQFIIRVTYSQIIFGAMHQMPHLNAMNKARIVTYLEDGRIMTDLTAEFKVGVGRIWRIKSKWLHEDTVKG